MAYKIAIASSDEINIDLTFGEAKCFLIIDVIDDGTYYISESRNADEVESHSTISNECTGGCGNANGGCSSSGGCCGGGAESIKVNTVLDCRCIICKKIGFNARKQLEKKAITSFDVECDIDIALKKIITYFSKVDNHQSLRGFANND